MDAPTIESHDDLAHEDVEISLESVELELALQCENTVAEGFENAMRHALDSTGGRLLFHMRADDGGTPQWIAAVSVGDGNDRRVLMVTIPAEGDIRIEPSEQSRTPIARIAPSFAEVMERLAA